MNRPQFGSVTARDVSGLLLLPFKVNKLWLPCSSSPKSNSFLGSAGSSISCDWTVAIRTQNGKLSESEIVNMGCHHLIPAHHPYRLGMDPDHKDSDKVLYLFMSG